MIDRRALVLLAWLVLPVTASAMPVRAAAPEPTPGSPVTMRAEPLLDGLVGIGSWAAIRVTLENDGPPVAGELRLASSRDASTYSLPVELAPGARQEHFLYGRTDAIARRFTVTFVSDQVVQASLVVPVVAPEVGERTAVVVAERPETLTGHIRDAIAPPGGPAARVVAVPPEALPARAEAWSAVDLLVWQDVDTARLDADRQAALKLWTLTGGDVVVLGGSTGLSTLGAFPADLLPYQPSAVVDVPLAELAAMVGSQPAEDSKVPALAGQLQRGHALIGSGDVVVAARAPYGLGTFTLIGFDPTTVPIDEPAVGAMWERIVPARVGASELRLPVDDESLVSSLGNLPAVQLPRSDHLFLLIAGYVIAIGPLNYVILRRRDRREWAWITMPLTILAFALAAYLFGVVLRGGAIVVHQLSAVHGAAGTDRGLADVHVAVFSPTRATFNVGVGPGALLSPPWAIEGSRAERPLDVRLGEPATLRGYGIGFGALRSFRATAAVDAPRVDADLRLEGDSIVGTVTNASALTLADVALVYGNAVQAIGDLAPGARHGVSVALDEMGQFAEPLAWRLFPPGGADEIEDARSVAARRALIQHLTGGWGDDPNLAIGGIRAGGPVVLAWMTGPTLEVDVGQAAQTVAETLFVLPARAQAVGPVTFAGALLAASVTIDAAEGFWDGGSFYASRGTVAIDYQPVGFDGSLGVSNLSVRLAQFNLQQPSSEGEELAPLPAEEQPDPDSPLASDPRPGVGARLLPRLQLFDRIAGTWVEFEPLTASRSYRIADPQRYVDEAGAFKVRLIVRQRDFVEFVFAARLEGTVE